MFDRKPTCTHGRRGKDVRRLGPRKLIAWLLAAATMSYAASATAQDSSIVSKIDPCNNEDAAASDARIAACTVLIESNAGGAPLLTMAHNNRGIAYSRKGQYDQAIRDFDDSIKFDPTNDKAFNNRGVVYRTKGDYDRSIADFTEALKLNPDYANAFANRAESYQKKGDRERALSDLNEAIRLEPTMANAWNDRCWVRAQAGAVQDALADCNEAVRLGRTASRLDSRGFVYLKSSQWNQAIADYNAALSLNPKLASSLYGRGQAKLKSGDQSGGNADIAAAMATQPNIDRDFGR